MINQLREKLSSRRDRIEAWFQTRWQEASLPLYSSVDVRNSHDKIAVVDTNAFPAGFNNLCPGYCDELGRAFADYLSARFPGTRRVLLFPEEHTRNKFYLENLHRLLSALVAAGYEPRLGTASPELGSSRVTLAGLEHELEFYRVERNGDRIAAGDFFPDLVISNNDFSAGAPAVLEGLGIPVIPSPAIGWHRRRKHRHFELLNRLAREFSQEADVDPWQISTHVAWCGGINFNDAGSRELVAAEVDGLLARIRADYEQRGMKDEPFVFIKHDSGTYGMAVMTARSGDEVRNASHKTRTKMQIGKGRTSVTELLIQEGVPTRDRLAGSPMEPVIYLVGERPVGGFYRLHRGRGDRDNLNVRGMEFRRLCFHKVREEHPESLDDRCEDAASLLLVFGALARLAALALGMEIKEQEEKG